MTTSISYTHEAIPAQASAPYSGETGACVEFHGIVRGLEKGEPLAGLFYEAYEAMASAVMQAILDDVGRAHRCHSATFIHRLGWVPVGEVSVYLRITSTHRGEALDCCAAALHRMKAEAPIWKMIERRPRPDQQNRPPGGI